MCSSPRVLVCKPSHYNISYEINPWMDVKRGAERALAEGQWAALHAKLVELQVDLHYVDPEPGWPDMVFTANAGLVSGKRVMLSRFRFPERQGEEPFFEAWFKARGFETRFPAGGSFEGAGDALFAGETLFCGFGFRSDEQVYAEIEQYFSLSKLVALRLSDGHFYHLDTCFCPLDATKAIVYPKAFDPGSLRLIERELEVLAVEETEALKFACNAVVINRDVVLPAGCPDLCTRLAKLGYRTHPIELTEFIKAGGAAKCLTLRIG